MVLHARIKWWKADIESFVCGCVKTFEVVLGYFLASVLSSNKDLALHNLLGSVINFI